MPDSSELEPAETTSREFMSKKQVTDGSGPNKIEPNKLGPNADFFRLNVGFIAHQSIGYSREFSLETNAVFLPPDLDLRNLGGSAIVSRTSEGLLVQVTVSAFIQSTCVRCLDDFSLELETDFTELYTFALHAQPDTELIYPESGQIDLSPLLREYLTIEIPINPVCKPDCKGLCPVCGENRNEKNCAHQSKPIDPRFSALQSLLDEE